MKASELHTRLSEQIDDLQYQIRKGARDQVEKTIELEEAQAKSKKVMEIIIKEGDRRLTGIEITALNEEN